MTTKKSKPASLTSSLLARKGEAEPAETPYSIAEASGTSAESRDTGDVGSTIPDETTDVAEASGSGNGNGHSMEGFGRLPLGDRDRDDDADPRAAGTESVSGGFSLPDGMQAGDPPITEPKIDPTPDATLDLSAVVAETSTSRSEPFDSGIDSPVAATPRVEEAEDDRGSDSAASDTPDPVLPAAMPSALSSGPSPDAPAGATADAAVNAEREAARDARLLRFVYIMAALTGIVAIVLYAGGWFVDKDTPQVAEQAPATETVASAGSPDQAPPSGAAEERAQPGAPSDAASGETPATPSQPPAEPSGSAAIPAAPPIAAPGFGDAGSKPGDTGITTGGKGTAAATSEPEPAPAAADEKAVSGIAVETPKPPVAPTVTAVDSPTVAATAPDPAPTPSSGAEAPKSAAPPSGGDAAKAGGTDSAAASPDKAQAAADAKVAAASPEKAPESAATSVVATTPPESPKVPDVQPPPILTAPKMPSAEKPAAADKPVKKVPNLRVLAPALVRPEPPQTGPTVTPPAAAAKPSATAQIPKESQTAALTPPKKPAVAPSKSGGNFLVQLASVRSEARAKAEWARLQKAFPQEFAGRALIVEERAIAGRGTFYRVQTGRFETLKDARAMCAGLKSKKQACLPVTRR